MDEKVKMEKLLDGFKNHLEIEGNEQIFEKRLEQVHQLLEDGTLRNLVHDDVEKNTDTANTLMRLAKFSNVKNKKIECLKKAIKDCEWIIENGQKRFKEVQNEEKPQTENTPKRMVSLKMANDLKFPEFQEIFKKELDKVHKLKESGKLKKLIEYDPEIYRSIQSLYTLYYYEYKTTEDLEQGIEMCDWIVKHKDGVEKSEKYKIYVFGDKTRDELLEQLRQYNIMSYEPAEWEQVVKQVKEVISSPQFKDVNLNEYRLILCGETEKKMTENIGIPKILSTTPIEVDFHSNPEWEEKQFLLITSRY